MRRISKGPEPKVLTEHRARRGGSFDDIRDKGPLRDALLREQLQGLIVVLARERGKTGSWPGDALLRKLSRIDAEGRLDEYVGVLESWLRRHARRA
jgi:hypothetical protein